MAPWLRVLLWVVVIVVPGGMALLPILVADIARRKSIGTGASKGALGEGGA